MTRIRSDDGLVCGEPEFVRLYNNAQLEQAREAREWVDRLRANGVAAAHPDDGWVDRTRNRVMLCYPDFDDGLKPGALLALGRPDDYRLVRVYQLEVNRFKLEWWHFEELPGWEASLVRGRYLQRDGRAVLASVRQSSGLWRRLAAQLGTAVKRLVRFVDRR